MPKLTDEQIKLLQAAGKKKKNEKLLSLAGLAMRARKLETGTDRICDEIRRHGYPSEHDDGDSDIRANGIVLVSSDASPNTKKRLHGACRFYGIRIEDTDISSDEVAKRLGKGSPCAAFATFDMGFADGMIKAIDCDTADIYKI